MTPLFQDLSFRERPWRSMMVRASFFRISQRQLNPWTSVRTLQFPHDMPPPRLVCLNTRHWVLCIRQGQRMEALSCVHCPLLKTRRWCMGIISGNCQELACDVWSTKTVVYSLGVFLTCFDITTHVVWRAPAEHGAVNSAKQLECNLSLSIRLLTRQVKCLALELGFLADGGRFPMQVN